MNTFCAFITFSALACVSLANPNYSGQYLGQYPGQYSGYAGQYAGSYAASYAGDYNTGLQNSYDNYGQFAGHSKGKGDIIYPAPNPCPEEPERGEVIVHKPAPIIVNRPPTKVTVNHPPVVVKPAPVVFRKPPSKTIRQPVLKDLPRRVQVEPVYFQVSKPAQRKVFVEPEPEPCPDNYYYNNAQSFSGPIASSYGNAGSISAVGNMQNYAIYPDANSNGQTYYANSKVMPGPDC